MSDTTTNVSGKSGLTTFLSCTLFHFRRVDRFYVGKTPYGILSLVLSVSCFLFLFSCATTGNQSGSKEETTRKSGQSATVKVTFIFKSTGNPKYDSFLETTKRLADNLDKASGAMDDFIPSLKRSVKSFMRLANDASDLSDDVDDVKQLFNSLIEAAKKCNLLITLYEVNGKIFVQLKADLNVEVSIDIVNKAKESIDMLNIAIENVVAIPNSLSNVAAESKSLILQGQSLVQSAPNDFAKNPFAIPGIVSTLKQAIDVITTIPAKSGSVISSAKKMMSDIVVLIKK